MEQSALLVDNQSGIGVHSAGDLVEEARQVGAASHLAEKVVAVVRDTRESLGRSTGKTRTDR